MEFLKKYGPAGVLGLVGGILFAGWVDPPTTVAYTMVLVLATLVLGAAVRIIAKLLGY